MMKKALALMFAAVLALILVACGSKAPEVPNAEIVASDLTAEAATAEIPEDTSEPKELTLWMPPEATAETLPPEDIELRLSPAKMVSELVSKTYNLPELRMICEFRGTLSELNQRYPVECVRVYAPQFIKGYRITYVGENAIVILDVDENENGEYVVYRGDYVEIEHSLDEYLAIPEGSYIEDVKAISPGGDYNRTVVHSISFYGLDLFSTHPTTDGYLVRIYYRWVAEEGLDYKRLVVDRVYYELI